MIYVFQAHSIAQLIVIIQFLFPPSIHMMEATNVVISSLINNRAFDLTGKFAY